MNVASQCSRHPNKDIPSIKKATVKVDFDPVYITQTIRRHAQLMNQIMT